MKRNKFKLHDCFLVRDDTIEEAMILYKIIDVKDEKVVALSIIISDEQVVGFMFHDEYDNEIPSDAIMLPDGTYERIKRDDAVCW